MKGKLFVGARARVRAYFSSVQYEMGEVHEVCYEILELCCHHKTVESSPDP